MAEWSNATVLKTVEVQASLGSNPSPSAAQKRPISTCQNRMPWACAPLVEFPYHHG